MIRQWVNIEDEGAPHALLHRLAQQIPVSAIDTLWIFPARRAAGIESTVIVIAGFETETNDRRRVSAIRFLVTRDRKARATVQEQLHEYATAPADALQRVVDGVVRRLGDDALEPPRAHAIEGNLERWNALLRELGGPATEQPATAADDNPRLQTAETDG